MTKAQAIIESIKHWKRMIAWAEKQKEDFTTNGMFRSIGEYWYAQYCPLCMKYYKTNSKTYEESCIKCPLYKHVGKGCDEVGHVWGKVDSARTKEDWIDNAKKMLKLLEELK